LEQIPHRRSILYVLSYGAAVVGCTVNSLTPVTVTLALRVAQIAPTEKQDVYALALWLGTLVTLLVTPIPGPLSDMTNSRFGMRRPWILAGTLGTWLAAFLMAGATTSAALIIAWIITTVFVGLGFPPLLAVIKDQFPASQHGTVSGIAGAAPAIGVIVGSWIVQLLPSTPLYMFVVPATAGSLLILQFLFVFQDRTRVSARSGFSLREIIRGFAFNPRSSPSLCWLLVVIALAFVGLVVEQNYLVYLLQDHLRIPVGELPKATYQAMLAVNVASISCCLLSGYLSDRIGWRRTLFSFGAILLAIGLVMQAKSDSMPEFVGACLVSGVGSGLLYGLLWALVVDANSGDATSARDIGLANVAITIPGILVPFLAPHIIASSGGNNYLALFGLCAVGTALVVPVLTRVRAAR
jgi:MFS family permease